MAIRGISDDLVQIVQPSLSGSEQVRPVSRKKKPVRRTSIDRSQAVRRSVQTIFIFINIIYIY